MSQASFRNKLIQKMQAADFARLSPHFERVDIEKRQVLLRRGDIIDYVYFLESGHASTLAKAPGRPNSIEVGMIGREGMTDFALSGRSPCETVVEMDGEAIRLRRTILVNAAEESASLAILILRFHQALLTQLSSTALSHGSYTLRERLPRLLLMLDDRSDDRDLPLTHEFFSWMLAVRRAGVSEAFTHLEEQRAVETARSRIRILDRDRLIDLAHGSYGAAEAEYERLFGAPETMRPLTNANALQIKRAVDDEHLNGRKDLS